jgi:hypothetical protein
VGSLGGAVRRLKGDSRVGARVGKQAEIRSMAEERAARCEARRQRRELEEERVRREQGFREGMESGVELELGDEGGGQGR